MHNKPVNWNLQRPYSRGTRCLVPQDFVNDPSNVDLTQLTAPLRSTFVSLPPDDALHAFAATARSQPHSWLKTTTHRVFRSFLSDYDVNGLLGMYPMHLLSTEQWTTLLASDRFATLLDVGAGDGGLTLQLAPLFTSITTTETSLPMVRRLRKRGYRCIADDLGAQPLADRFTCVTCLNVIDRTPQPLRLLTSLAANIEPGGQLVVATPLPLRPFYFDGPQTREPKESLRASGPSWERAANQLLQQLTTLLPELSLLRWTRTPYLSWGDSAHGLYQLDDFVGVWQRTANAP